MEVDDCCQATQIIMKVADDSEFGAWMVMAYRSGRGCGRG